jgi:peptidoglycan/xylan/chitin deacetylase (PgdA/CDA1 family)
MIGIIGNFSEHDVVREFFELFKTPWEFYRSDRQYDVLLCAGGAHVDAAANLVVLYAGSKMDFDDERKIQTGGQRRDCRILLYQGNRIPIYGDTVTFPERENGILTDQDTHESAAYLDLSEQGALARVGYDLFSEIRRLLTVGQPTVNADIPALELHIAFLRDLITGCGLPLVEIPPVPDGYPFIACLTHDVDHPSIRQHKWDHTMFGFLYRAVFGSLRHLMGGRMPFRDLVRNWAAALKLPFVHLGVAKDFWREFDDGYLALENGVCSTFFVIPFKNCPGKNSHGEAPRFRAARYDARDIADTIRKLITAGCEVGLHGIDAWLDSSRGHEELEEIRRLTGGSEIGVRMHWLYYDQQSPVALEQAEAAYDSTIGYNDTVGYRAATTQAYKPLQATRLLELPLHAMDTALFYPDHLGLSSRQATTLLGRLVDNAVQFGGCFTINWHDRSLAPERLWGICYRELIEDLKNRGAWFATAGQAVSWFRKRRSVVFEMDCIEADAVRAKLPADHGDHLPGLRLRIHKARESPGIGAQGSDDYVDTTFDESIDTTVPCGGRR